MWNAPIGTTPAVRSCRPTSPKRNCASVRSPPAAATDDAEIRTRLYRFSTAGVPIPTSSELHRLATHHRDLAVGDPAFLHTGPSNAQSGRFQPPGRIKRVACGFRKTPRTHAAGYALNCTMPSGPASDSPPRSCPVNFEEPINDVVGCQALRRHQRTAWSCERGPRASLVVAVAWRTGLSAQFVQRFRGRHAGRIRWPLEVAGMVSSSLGARPVLSAGR